VAYVAFVNEAARSAGVVEHREQTPETRLDQIWLISMARSSNSGYETAEHCHRDRVSRPYHSPK